MQELKERFESLQALLFAATESIFILLMISITWTSHCNVFQPFFLESA
jgi:hypothetical protein